MYGRSSVCAATQNGVAPTSVSRFRPTLVTSGFFVACRFGFAPRARSFLASVKLSRLSLGTSPGLLTPVFGRRV